VLLLTLHGEPNVTRVDDEAQLLSPYVHIATIGDVPDMPLVPDDPLMPLEPDDPLKPEAPLLPDHEQSGPREMRSYMPG